MANNMTETYNKLPKSPLALYVNLYCKKTNSSKNKRYLMMEATKSWVSMSKADKQYFIDVFKECENKLKQKFATYLQNAEPYMKKKHRNKRCTNHKELAATGQNVANHSNPCLPSTEDQQAYEQNNESKCLGSNVHNESQRQHDLVPNYNENVHLPIIQDGNKPVVSRVVPEPMPPIKSSKELFEIIKNTCESAQNINWTLLSKSEKQRYQRAVTTIKNDYIKQYTEFLEQLTQEELFQYYKSKF